MAKATRSGEGPSIRVQLDELEEAIEALRVAHEKYFTGVERVSPARMREQVTQRLRVLETQHVRSTVLRFRLAGLRARLVTYKHYWTRVELEIERGVSRRDLLRSRRVGAPPPPQAIGSRDGAEAPVSRSDERHADSLGLDTSNLRAVYEKLVEAKRAAGEAIDGLTYSALVRKLSREVPKLQAKHNCEKVRFEVATSGGKVRLRARPL